MQPQPRILYVEDDIESRDIMRVLVNEVMGVTDLEIFEDSLNFMTRVEALPFKPDVILLDIHVPPITGFEMLKLLRNSDQYKNVPIIAITASVMNEEVQILKDSGFNGVFAKPLDMDRFPILIDKAMNGQKIWTITE